MLRDQARRTLQTHAEDMDASDRSAVEEAIIALDGVLANPETNLSALAAAHTALAAVVQAYAEKLYAQPQPITPATSKEEPSEEPLLEIAETSEEETEEETVDAVAVELEEDNGVPDQFAV
jgi:hypothetical protein